MSGLRKILKSLGLGSGKGETNSEHLKIGAHGEDLAVSFLEGLGYTVLARNYRKRFGELDIVAEDGETVVFVEVKTRKNDNYGNPFEAVDIRKQRKLSRMAQDYIIQNNLEDRSARFDVVAVRYASDTEPTVEHVRDAFEFQE